MFVTAAYAQSTPTEGETHTETGVATEAGHEAGVFPPFDHTTFASSLLWLVITFGFFYMLMQKVIVPRVGSILDDRNNRISQDLDEAARLKAEADAAIETYERELAAARAKAQGIAAAARDSAKAKADADRAAVEAELSQKVAAAEARIGEIKAKAFADVGTIAEETASAVVDQLIGGSVNKADVAAAVAAASSKQEA